MKKYDVRRVRVGEEQQLLDQGYEPFAVSPQDTSYRFLNPTSWRSETQHQTTDYIYLRKVVSNEAG